MLANYAVRLRNAEFQSDPRILDDLVQRTVMDQQQQPQYHNYGESLESRGEEIDDQ